MHSPTSYFYTQILTKNSDTILLLTRSHSYVFRPLSNHLHGICLYIKMCKLHAWKNLSLYRPVQAQSRLICPEVLGIWETKVAKLLAVVTCRPCNTPFREHLPEDSHNSQPKQIAGWGDYNIIGLRIPIGIGWIFLVIIYYYLLLNQTNICT